MKSKAFALTHRGMEDIAAEEIVAMGGENAVAAAPGVITFDSGYGGLCLLCYRAQSLVKVAVLLSEFEAAPRFEAALESAERSLKDIDFGSWLDTTFSVSCLRTGEHEYSSHDLAMALARTVKERVPNEWDLKKPALSFLAAVSGSKGFLGVDLAGIDMGKRDYKVFATSSSLKGTLGYALVRLSGFGGEGSLLDPFCKCGVIPIEAAAMAGRYPLNFFRKESLAFRRIPALGVDAEQLFSEADAQVRESKARIFCTDPDMRHLSAAKKNAKVAGLNKSIRFSRMDVEWLDTKFGEREVGSIASYLTFRKAAEVSKICREFFYQAGYILSGSGKVAVISNRMAEARSAAERYRFVPYHARKLWAGKQEMEAVVFSRGE